RVAEDEILLLLACPATPEGGEAVAGRLMRIGVEVVILRDRLWALIIILIQRPRLRVIAHEVSGAFFGILIEAFLCSILEIFSLKLADCLCLSSLGSQI